jgi:pimeloyl-ACP methyl ester carboxylesterase
MLDEFVAPWSSNLAILATSGGAPYALAYAQLGGHLLTSVAIVGGMGDTLHPPAGTRMVSINRFMNWSVARSPRTGTLAGRVSMFMSRIAPALFLKIGIRQLPPSDQLEMRRTDVYNTFLSISKELGWRRGQAFARDFEIFRSGWLQRIAGRTRCPVSLWHGSDDRNVPVEYAEFVQATLTTSELHVNPATGHLLLRQVVDDAFKFIAAS